MALVGYRPVCRLYGPSAVAHMYVLGGVGHVAVIVGLCFVSPAGLLVDSVRIPPLPRLLLSPCGFVC